MTTTSAQPFSTYGGVSSLRAALSRDEFFAGLYIAGCAAALGSNILRAVVAGDWTGGAANISVIVWFSCFVGISLLLRDKTQAIRPLDLLVALVFLALIAAPASEINWAAVSGLSLYILLFTKGSPARRRGAVIMLALTAPMLWSRLLFSFFAKFFLEIDALFVGWLLGTPRNGNVINFADHSGSMVILPACSSLANVSLAFLCWITMSVWLDHQRSYKDWIWCLLACGSVVAANVIRMAIMGLGQWHYETFHYGWGATLVNAIILVLIVGFCVLGLRRELFSRT